MSHPERERLAGARRVVVKVGTAVVTRPEGGLALGRLGALVEQLHGLRASGREVLLVTSGAVGLGARRLGFTERPTAVVDRQACAAAGQGALLALYDDLFRQVGLVGAQVLLTEEDFLDRQRYLNLHATLERLLALGAVPIINENDTLSTAEIALHKGQVFGDNDRLSALVAAGLDADLLLLLTNVDGVYTAPPGAPGAARVCVWGPETAVELGGVSAGGRGGMRSKIEAARVARSGGAAVVIASGFDGEVVRRALAGDDVGTLFPPDGALSRRRRWLAFATAPAARLVVNDGARDAMVARNASLLARGVVRVEGSFAAGAVVSVVSEAGCEFARGLASRGSDELAAESNGRTKPLVHRDNVVILQGGA